ncbi:P-loop containing nucleoside triphosphate hydrolase protein [Jimgerdemannia flammicorona]|uniref:P-loop containing nucleoside triphosphate hydrolase protein n=1 Tax=Jimgerdemannia flammicorona TaxID=994334 RepID=A0A433DKN8_9FUNG|nr:P-loop containing nucleoside triphosphate hydrolase protein [Jimgerdemannia flammicorona]
MGVNGSKHYYNSLRSMGDVVSEVCEWSSTDIENDDLLTPYLIELPTKFGNPREYFHAFGVITLEEVRTQLKKGLEDLVPASSLPVEGVTTSHHPDYGFSLTIGFRTKDESYLARPIRTCDVLLLTPSFPTTAAQNRIIAVVQKTEGFDSDESIHLCEVQVHESHKMAFMLALRAPDHQSLWDVALLASIPVVRSMRTLIGSWEGGGCFPHFMNTILGRQIQDAPPITKAPVQRAVLATVLGDETLNDSQRNCIIQVLEKDGVHLVHGPPGTGKTATLATILACLFESNIPTVQTAPTNIAVGEIAKRFLARIKSGRQSSQHTLGDVLLIGDGDKIDLDGPLDSIFLDRRVDRLAEAFAKWPTLLIDFERFLSEFPRKLKGTKPDEPMESPWKLFCKMSSGHTANVEKCIAIFLSDLPSSAIATLTRDDLTRNLKLFREFPKNLQTYQSEYQESDEFALYCSQGLVLSSIDRLQKAIRNVAISTRNLTSIGKLTDVKLKRELLDNARIVFSTVGCTGRKIMESVLQRVHTVILDEATQLPEAETALLLRQTLRRLVLAGDHKQLPATVISPFAKKCLYGRSLFERLQLVQYTSSFLLDTQYRMRPEISKFPTKMFYGSQLKDWEGLAEKQPMPWHIATTPAGEKLFPPFAVFDLDSFEIKDPFGTSIYNETEADFIVNYLTEFAKVLLPTANVVVGVGVLTPYAAQVVKIKERLTNVVGEVDYGVFRISPVVEVRVKSVDESQGQEKDVIIISLVRSNDRGEIGFVADERRLNVALTRAKHSCFVVGNTSTLTRRHGIFTKLIADSKQREVYFKIRDYPNLSKLTNKRSPAVSRAAQLLKMNSTPSKSLQASLMLNTLWKLSLTRKVLDTIGRIPTREGKEKIFGFLSALADGYRPKNRTRTSVLEYNNVIESCVTSGNLAVVWAVALEAKEYSYNQIIQVYELVPRTETSQAIERTELSLKRHTDEYLQAISKTEKIDAPNTGKKRVIPISIPKRPKICWHRSLKKDLDDGNVGEQVLDELTLAKKHRLTAETIRLVFENTIDNIELPIDLSEAESSIVNNGGSAFILGRSGTGKTTVMLMRMLQREQAYYAQVDSYEKKPMQMMLTASPTLCGAMSRYYSKLHKSIVHSDEQDQDFQQEDNHRDRLDDPQNPAFVCFADFLVIMDRYLGRHFFPKNRRLLDERFEVGRQSMSSSRAYREDGGKEVTFSRFRDIYWPHFNLFFHRKYDVSVVWTEFQSCIKGSLKSLLYPKGKLPLDAFLELANSRNSTLNLDERESIYGLFQKYERMKRDKRDWDVGDLTSHIFLELANTGYRGRMIDFIYIDEVQDLTPAQMALFKYVCRNRDGFVFAGDTAQTISAGVGFRFQAVRDLFYGNILPYIDPTLTNVAKFVPKMNILTQNYRTHSGILNLANWIVKILYKSFPSMIDKLPEEESLISGPTPIFLEDTTIDTLLIHLFGEGDSVSHEFGAEQAIIVRDERTKEKISQRIQDAVVLTVYEAKGLEFEDVLCYDFFADSPLDSWGILRWIDSDLTANKSEKRKPALDIWKSRNLVKDLSAIDPNGIEIQISPLARNTSTPEQWQNLGKILFEKSLYKDAKRCFVRGQDHRSARLCEALIVETEAEIYADKGKVAESQRKYFDVAQLYEDIDEHLQAASAYKKAQKYDGAQRMFRVIHKYDDALGCCWKGKLSKEALNIFALTDIDSSVKEEWVRKFAILCHSVNDTQGVLKFLGYYKSENTRCAFLERYKYYDELLRFYTTTQRYGKMAEINEQKGNLFEAVRCWKRHGDTAGQIRVLLRLARPFFCLTLAGIQFGTVTVLRDLLRDFVRSNSRASFELKFLLTLFDPSPVDVNIWTQLLKETQARKGVDCDGMELMATFLVLQALWKNDRWQTDQQTFVRALKSCRRKFAEMRKNLADTVISRRKYECYRIFGLEYNRNPEYCLVNSRVLPIIRKTSAKSGESVLEAKSSWTEMKLSEFATLAQEFVVAIAEKTMRRSLNELKQIAESLNPCSTLVLDNGTRCKNEKCVRVHEEVKFLREEKQRIQLQIDIVELVADCKNLGPEFETEYKKYRGGLFDMLNPNMPNLFNPLTIIGFRKYSSVNIIFEEYKREVKAKELNELRLAMTLLISESTSALIWYPHLNQEKNEKKTNLWTLWQAFNWLRVCDVSEDPILMAGIMGANALLTIAGLESLPARPSISLPPIFYTPLLEKFLTILVLRHSRFRASCVPARLLANLICSNKSAEFDYILRRDCEGEPAWDSTAWGSIKGLKDMLCSFFEDNGAILSRVNWNNIAPLGLLCKQLERLDFANTEEITLDGIVELIRSWKDEFLVITDRDIPSFLTPLPQVKISVNKRIKVTLIRHFSGFSSVPPAAAGLAEMNDRAQDVARTPEDRNQISHSDQGEMTEESAVMRKAPVGEECEVNLPPRIHRRICQVLASVRARIKRRNAIQHPRDRYTFVATEYFNRRAVSSDFLSYYVNNVCQIRAELATNLEKIESFLKSPPVMEGIGEIVDEMLTYKETLEDHFERLDVNNPCFVGTTAKRSAEEMVAAVRQHQKKGRKLEKHLK